MKISHPLNRKKWLPRYNILKFFLVGQRERCCVSHQSKDISDLKERITAAVKTIDEEILRRTWTEIECRLDVHHATNASRIEIY